MILSLRPEKQKTPWNLWLCSTYTWPKRGTYQRGLLPKITVRIGIKYFLALLARLRWTCWGWHHFKFNPITQLFPCLLDIMVWGVASNCSPTEAGGGCGGLRPPGEDGRPFKKKHWSWMMRFVPGVRLRCLIKGYQRWSFLFPFYFSRKGRRLGFYRLIHASWIIAPPPGRWRPAKLSMT